MNQKRFCWTCSKALPEIGYTVVNGLAYCPNHLENARSAALVGRGAEEGMYDRMCKAREHQIGQSPSPGPLYGLTRTPARDRLHAALKEVNPRLMKPFRVDDIVMVGCGLSFGRRAIITSVQGCTYEVWVEGATPGECASKGIFQRSELTEMPAKVRTQPSAEEYGERPPF